MNILNNCSSITQTQSATDSVVKNEEKGFRLLQTAEHIVFHRYPIVAKKQTVEPEGMTIGKLFKAGIINDDTEITVGVKVSRVLIMGNWFSDNILDYINQELGKFIWQDDNKVFVYPK